ncbi:osm1 [Symbiodinium microadriaticum]|nr:osm1 [Symbiodinium microadriaticum]
MVLASGGFGADFGADSLLATYRPDLLHLPTTNGEHCTGDAIKMGEAIGAATIDLEWVQVHPTGLVKPDDPDAKVKFLAAEALRGVGGIVLDANGDRFCNELGRRDYVTGEMWKNKPPFRLCLNKAAADEIIWHAKHYTGRGVMKFYASGEDLAKDMGVPLQKIVDAHQKHFEAAKKQEKDPDGGPFPAYPSGKTWDEPSGKTGSGKKFFHNIIDGSKVPTEPFYVAIITPVIHYCMGGLECTVDAECIDKKSGKVIPGLYVAGEAAGGIHGNNRLGGNSLLDCVVFGRVAGKAACKFTFGAGEKFKPCPPPGELKACSLHSRWPAGGGPEFVVVGKCILFNKTGDATAPVGGLAPGKVAVLRAEAEVRVGVGKVKAGSVRIPQDDDFKVLVTAAANETSKIFNWIEHEVTLKAPWLCKRRHSLCYWAKTITRIGYPKSVEFTVIGSLRPHEELSVLASWLPEGLVTKGSREDEASIAAGWDDSHGEGLFNAWCSDGIPVQVPGSGEFIMTAGTHQAPLAMFLGVQVHPLMGLFTQSKGVTVTPRFVIRNLKVRMRNEDNWPPVPSRSAAIVEEHAGMGGMGMNAMGMPMMQMNPMAMMSMAAMMNNMMEPQEEKTVEPPPDPIDSRVRDICRHFGIEEKICEKLNKAMKTREDFDEDMQVLWHIMERGAQNNKKAVDVMLVKIRELNNGTFIGKDLLDPEIKDFASKYNLDDQLLHRLIKTMKKRKHHKSQDLKDMDERIGNAKHPSGLLVRMLEGLEENGKMPPVACFTSDAPNLCSGGCSWGGSQILGRMLSITDFIAQDEEKEASGSSLLNLMVGVAIFQPGDVGTAGGKRPCNQVMYGQLYSLALFHFPTRCQASELRKGAKAVALRLPGPPLLELISVTKKRPLQLDRVSTGGFLPYRDKLVQLGRLPQSLRILAKESRLLCLRGEYLKDFELGQVVLSRPAEIWIGAEGGSLSVLSAQHVARFWPQAADAHEAGFKAAEWHALDSSGG